MPDALMAFIIAYGDLAVGLILFVEGIGIPLPGETAILLGAAITRHGDVPIARVLLIGSLGGILGSTIAYWIGRAGGIALLHRHGPRVFLTRQRIDRTHAMLERHGAAAIIIAKYIAFVRILASFIAGAAQMSFGRFFLYNAVGTLIWVATFSAVGYAFGSDLERLERWIRASGYFLFASLILGVCLYLLWSRRRKKNNTVSK
jgi:membrane protein DedA with SNARE-associated domain